MSSFRRSRWVALVVAGVAVVFGLVTLAAGTRVLLGADPGYVVFRPLLLFNTAMGAAYVAVGLLAWRGNRLGLHGAAAVALSNLAVLGVIAYLYTPGGSIASESLRAMGLRAAVWVALFLALLWAGGSTPEVRNDD